MWFEGFKIRNFTKKKHFRIDTFIYMIWPIETNFGDSITVSFAFEDLESGPEIEIQNLFLSYLEYIYVRDITKGKSCKCIC